MNEVTRLRPARTLPPRATKQQTAFPVPLPTRWDIATFLMACHLWVRRFAGNKISHGTLELGSVGVQ